MHRFVLAMIVVPVIAVQAQVRPTRPPRPATPEREALPVPPAQPVQPVQSTQPPQPLQPPQAEREFWLRDPANLDEMRLLQEERARDLAARADERRMELELLARERQDRARGDQRLMAERLREQRLLDMERMAGGTDARFLGQRPRAPWAQGDPADSLYKEAREALNRGEYRRAAELFSVVARRYPSSAYAPSSSYWEAFARYRLGTTEELRLASQALDALAARSTQLSRETDVAGLRARIDGALAMRGDPDAVRRVQVAARNGEPGAAPCDKEELAVRVEALNALAQMDPTGSTPTIRRVLDRKDECSTELRRRAVFVLARRADASSATMLADVARNDPSLTVRAEAIQYLMRMPGDVGLQTLEEILRTSDEERIQRAAVSALMTSDNPRARQSVRALLDRRDANERLRIEMLSRYHDKSSPEDAAFLRQYYTRTESERLREATINALARMGGKENEDFLMAIVRNEEEPSSMRSAALGRLSRMEAISVNDLAKLYDVADTRTMREQVISALANRKENEATDKLIDIARNSTDAYARKQVINVLTRRNDPRAAAALKELIEK